MEHLLSTRALAQYLDVPVQTIYAWRAKGQGPKGIRVGKHVRFRTSDVESWLADHADEGEAA